MLPNRAGGQGGVVKRQIVDHAIVISKLGFVTRVEQIVAPADFNVTGMGIQDSRAIRRLGEHAVNIQADGAVRLGIAV